MRVKFRFGFFFHRRNRKPLSFCSFYVEYEFFFAGCLPDSLLDVLISSLKGDVMIENLS